MFGIGVLLLVAVCGGSLAWGEHPGEALTRNTVRLSLAWYLVAAMGMLSMPAGRGRSRSQRTDDVLRWCWTWGAVVFVVHVAAAFHHYHHWSHASAFEATRVASGFGHGVYVSYLFTLVWIGDAVWWWAAPDRRRRRTLGRSVALHGFLAWIIFNGTVVFESGWIRYAGCLGVAALASVAMLSRSRRTGMSATDATATDATSTDATATDATATDGTAVNPK